MEVTYIGVNNKKIYKPTNDYMFGRIFGDQESTSILKDFLQAILPDISIKEINIIKQAHIDRIDPESKFGKMDILATLNNGIKINIEMQLTDYHNTIPRTLYYIERLGSSDLKEKFNYTDMPRTISIWILGYNLFEDGTYHDISRLRRDFNNSVLTDNLEIHYIQLPKFKHQCKEISTNLEKWLTFIINENAEVIKNMDNENIKKAAKKLEELNNDEVARALAEYYADAKRNEISALKGARDEGERTKAIKIIQKMLAENMDLEMISKLTDTSIDEILDIKNNKH